MTNAKVSKWRKYASEMLYISYNINNFMKLFEDKRVAKSDKRFDTLVVNSIKFTVLLLPYNIEGMPNRSYV